MVNKEKVKELLKIRATMHDEDHRISDVWEDLIEAFGEDEYTIVDCIDNMTDEEVYYSSEVFEELTLVVKTQSFVDSLRKIVTKRGLEHIYYQVECSQNVL